MAIISKSTQGMIQESTVGNNCNLLLFACPQPGQIESGKRKISEHLSIVPIQEPMSKESMAEIYISNH